MSPKMILLHVVMRVPEILLEDTRGGVHVVLQWYSQWRMVFVLWPDLWQKGERILDWVSGFPEQDWKSFYELQGCPFPWNHTEFICMVDLKGNSVLVVWVLNPLGASPRQEGWFPLLLTCDGRSLFPWAPGRRRYGCQTCSASVPTSLQPLLAWTPSTCR